MRTFIAILFLSGIIYFSAWGTNPGNTCSSVQSIDTVRVREQVWMLRNLDVDTFRNGDTIKEAASLEDWMKACKEGVPAWCYYNNDPDIGKMFGKLYNWPAVNDPRGLAPEGFRIPIYSDFRKLLDYVHEDNVFEAIKKLVDNEHYKWANNKSGFSALRAGQRDGDTTRLAYYDPINRFINFNAGVVFWTSELYKNDKRYVWVLVIDLDPPLNLYRYNKYWGLPVRCILDN